MQTGSTTGGYVGAMGLVTPKFGAPLGLKVVPGFRRGKTGRFVGSKSALTTNDGAGVAVVLLKGRGRIVFSDLTSCWRPSETRASHHAPTTKTRKRFIFAGSCCWVVRIMSKKTHDYDLTCCEVGEDSSGFKNVYATLNTEKEQNILY